MFDVGETAKSRGRLSDIGTIVGGATPSKKKLEDYFCTDGIGWITPRDLANTDNKFIAHGALDITREGFDSCSVKALPAGSVLFSSRAPIGYIAIASDELTTNQGFKSIVPRAEIGTAFTYCLLVRNKQRIADAGSGTTFPEVSANTMANIEISLPSESLCQEFSSWAQPVLKRQSRIEEESQLLRIARDALLPRLMSGEVDVSRIDLRQLNGHLAAYPIWPERKPHSQQLLSEQFVMGASALKVGCIAIYAPDEKPIAGIGNMAFIASFPSARKPMHIVSVFEDLDGFGAVFQDKTNDCF